MRDGEQVSRAQGTTGMLGQYCCSVWEMSVRGSIVVLFVGLWTSRRPRRIERARVGGEDMAVVVELYGGFCYEGSDVGTPGRQKCRGGSHRGLRQRKAGGEHEAGQRHLEGFLLESE